MEACGHTYPRQLKVDVLREDAERCLASAVGEVRRQRFLHSHPHGLAANVCPTLLAEGVLHRDLISAVRRRRLTLSSITRDVADVPVTARGSGGSTRRGRCARGGDPRPEKAGASRIAADSGGSARGSVWWRRPRQFSTSVIALCRSRRTARAPRVARALQDLPEARSAEAAHAGPAAEQRAGERLAASAASGSYTAVRPPSAAMIAPVT
jgi:hypothetical protein